MREVTRAQGLAVIRKIEKRAPQMAVIAKQALGAISRLALDTERADIELVYRQTVRTKPTTHKRPLRPEEIPKFFEALDNFPGYFPTKGALHLLWLTLVRPKEILEARWDEFDLDDATWVIPAERMKMGKPHRVPLPTQAVDILKRIKGVSGSFDHLVPNRKDPKRHASHSILIKAIHSMGYGGKFSPHAIRVTGRTILGEQGHPYEVLERQIAHVDKKHVRAYDQGDRLEARRVIMQGWADYIDGLCSGAKVANLNAPQAN
jgi:integrase